MYISLTSTREEQTQKRTQQQQQKGNGNTTSSSHPLLYPPPIFFCTQSIYMCICIYNTYHVFSFFFSHICCLCLLFFLFFLSPHFEQNTIIIVENIVSSITIASPLLFAFSFSLWAPFGDPPLSSSLFTSNTFFFILHDHTSPPRQQNTMLSFHTSPILSTNIGMPEKYTPHDFIYGFVSSRTPKQTKKQTTLSHKTKCCFSQSYKKRHHHTLDMLIKKWYT
eukprot:UN01464